ncbi:MAG: fibronectin type III domain-containing protein [Candidatus Aminicenantes bacterium]|nr:fibronectin type III domain-containing protein [Candidatus Aminicenantes bacterium]
MTKRTILRGPLAVGFAVLAAACGHKGPLLPPVVRVPQPPGDFTCLQRGSRVLLRWTNPESYVDGEPMPGPGTVEVWVLETPKAEKVAPAAAADVEAKGQVVGRVAGKAGEPGEFAYELAPREIEACVLNFALRARDPGGRVSALTEVCACAPQALPRPPTDLRVRVFVDRLEVGWTAPEATIDGRRPAAPIGYLVLRAEETGPFELLTAEPLKAPPFADKDFEFEHPYRYVVRAAANTAAPYLTSDDSPVLEVRAKDEFPPRPPLGIVIVAGEGFISLSWEPGPEKDLAGYKVWRRAEGEGGFLALTPQPILENAYTDRAVEKGAKYTYTLTAVDSRGNESERSAAAVETARGGRP